MKDSPPKYSDFRSVKRVVKPRRFSKDERWIIAVTRTEVLLERTGELLPFSELPRLVATEPASIVVVENAGKLVKQLDQFYSDSPNWQFKMSPVVRRKYRQHKRQRPTEVLETVVGFFGFRATNKEKPNRYHMPLDPTAFVSTGIRSLVSVEQEPSEVRALLQWGVDVREWCQSQLIKVTTRNGGIAAALLKDPRFYPEARRKVPRATNDRARENLPGNHYELFVPENTYHEAYYVDMTAAHHTAAAKIDFPDANGLLARGKFRHPPEDYKFQKVWARRGTPKYNSLIKTHGLFLLRVSIPFQSMKMLRENFPPPFVRNGFSRSDGSRKDYKLIYVYSNELDLLELHRVQIEGIEAAWTSAKTDTGLNQYAQWALAEVQRMSENRKQWGKPTLLATYGMLAARPNHIEFGFKYGGGESKIYMTPGGPIAVKATRTKREVESGIVNVIHRGMIEAQIRKESLMYARKLTEQGAKVLAIYADSIIISSDSPVPLIEEPWRIKSPMSRLQFFNTTSFDSEEMTRLPGIPREGLDKLHRLAMVRQVAQRRRLSPGESAYLLLCGGRRRRGQYVKRRRKGVPSYRRAAAMGILVDSARKRETIETSPRQKDRGERKEGQHGP